MHTCEGAWKSVKLGAVAHKLSSPGHVTLHGMTADVPIPTIRHDFACKLRAFLVCVNDICFTQVRSGGDTVVLTTS